MSNGYLGWFLICYLALITYCSIVDVVPGTGWQVPTTPYWHFLSEPWLPSITTFDVVANILAYIPVGLLSFWRSDRSLRPSHRVLRAAAFGLLWSFAMESVQMWRPSRDPSPVDLFTNTLGSLCGACLALLWSPPSHPLRFLRALRRTVVPSNGHAYVVVLALLFWCSFNCAPFVPKVDVGQVLLALAPVRNAGLTPSLIDPIAVLRHMLLIAGLGMSIASARHAKPALLFIFTALVIATVCIKPLVTGRQLTAEFAYGTLAGLTLFIAGTGCQSRAYLRGRIGAFMLLLSCFLAILQFATAGNLSYASVGSLAGMLATVFVTLFAFAGEVFRDTARSRLQSAGTQGLLIVLAITIAVEFRMNAFAVAGFGFSLLVTVIAGWLLALYVVHKLQQSAVSSH